MRLLPRKFARDTEGAATIEFVILFPVFFAIVLAVFESGWLMTKYMMLDRGVDLAVRDIRLRKDPGAGHDDIKDSICDYASIIPDCKSTLKVQLIPLQVASNPPDLNNSECFDRSLTVQVASSFQSVSLSGSQLVFLRACVLVDPMIPGLGLGLLLPQEPNSGGHQMVSYTAFKNEPN